MNVYWQLIILSCLLVAVPPAPKHRLTARTLPGIPKTLLAALLLGFIVVQGPGVAVAVCLVVAMAAWKIHVSQRVVRRRKAAAATASALGALVSDLRSGATPHSAIARVAEDAATPVREPLAIAAHQARTGASVGAALAGAPEELKELRQAGKLWLIAESHGIGIANLLEHMQQRIDAELRHDRATAAALQGAKATAIILSLLPLAGIGLGTAMGARPVQFLTTTSLGGILLVAGTGLSCGGYLWIDRIVANASAGGAA